MESTTRNLLRDILELWKHEVRSFLGYVVEVSAPIVVNDQDEALLTIFREAHERELDLVRRTLSLMGRCGIHADPPAYDMGASVYNFMRPGVLADVFLSLAARVTARLGEVRSRHEAAESLEDRLFRAILEDTLRLVQDTSARLQKTLGTGEEPPQEKAVQEPVEEEAEAESAAPEGEVVGEPDPAWHDEDLPIEERMKLADAGGLFEKLFAAMAQTDCTACGYDCEGYARAIADGKEDDLAKCTPGELETQEMLEKILKEAGR